MCHRGSARLLITSSGRAGERIDLPAPDSLSYSLVPVSKTLLSPISRLDTQHWHETFCLVKATRYDIRLVLSFRMSSCCVPTWVSQLSLSGLRTSLLIQYYLSDLSAHPLIRGLCLASRCRRVIVAPFSCWMRLPGSLHKIPTCSHEYDYATALRGYM